MKYRLKLFRCGDRGAKVDWSPAQKEAIRNENRLKSRQMAQRLYEAMNRDSFGEENLLQTEIYVPPSPVEDECLECHKKGDKCRCDRLEMLNQMRKERGMGPVDRLNEKWADPVTSSSSENKAHASAGFIFGPRVGSNSFEKLPHPSIGFAFGPPVGSNSSEEVKEESAQKVHDEYV